MTIAEPAMRSGNIIDDSTLLNAIPHVVLTVDGTGRLMHANSAAEIFFDLGLSVLQRSLLSDLVAIGSPLISLVDQVRRTHVSINEYNVDLGLPRAQNERLIDVYCAPLPENPEHLLVILQQRNMAKMIERQITHRTATRSVSGLASVLAHEIKNPLSGIRGAAQLLEMTQDDEGRTWTQLICSETDRIRDLVDRMEVFGDERPVLKGPVNIHRVLEHVQKIAENGFASGVTFDAQYDPSLPSLSGQRDPLVQAFLNLVKNAAESVIDGERGGSKGKARRDPRIVLRTAFRPGVHLTLPGTRRRVSLPLMISVEDNGPGIPEELRVHLFDPFVTSKSGGSGLGLALVAKIVHDHGGVIEFDSEPGKTVFRVLMPIHDDGEPN